MNSLSLYSENFCLESAELRNQLDEKTSKLGWIWGSGEDPTGFWCEIYTPQEIKLVRSDNLLKVLRRAILYIDTWLPKHDASTH